MNETANAGAGWPRVLIFLGVLFFLIALTLSAIVIPQLRLLHILQSLIYFAVLVLAMRNSPWGFGAGTIIAIAWNCLSIFITHLFQAGLEEMLVFTRTGHTERPDALAVAIGGIGHFVLIVGCLVAFLRSRPRGKAWARFFGGGLIVLAYIALIIFLAGPR
jgi:hypothetical protein